ncbi:hypothetical protein [Dishui Lake phycodnavirus 3]|nr:hypothetical protein [Dishui Lake phycodnavirus 3]
MPNIGNTGVFTNVYLRKVEETTPNVAQNVVMSYDTKSHQVKERGSQFVEASVYLGDGGLLSNLSFGQIASTSTFVPSKLIFSNVDTSFVTTSKVGISNTVPVHTLDVGSNVYVDDTGDYKLVVRGDTRVFGNTVFEGNVTTLGATELIYATITVIEDPLFGYGQLNPGKLGYDLGSYLIRDRDGVKSNVVAIYRTPDQSNLGFEEYAIGFTRSVIVSKDIIPSTSESINVHVYGNLTSDYYFGDASTLSNITFQQISESPSGNVTSRSMKFSNITTSIATTSNVGIGVNTPHARLDVHNDVHTWTIRVDRADNLPTIIHFREIEIYDIAGRPMFITTSRQSNLSGNTYYRDSSNAYDGNFSTIVQTDGTADDWVEFDVVSQIPPGYIKIFNVTGFPSSNLTGCSIIVWDENATEPFLGRPKLPQYYNQPIIDIFEEKEFVINPSIHYPPLVHAHGQVLTNLVSSNVITSTGRMGINATKNASLVSNPSFLEYSQFHITTEDGTLSARMGVDQTVGPYGSIYIQGSNNFTSDNVNLLLLPKNGKVGIGTFTPQQELDVDGNVFVNGRLTFGSVPRQTIDLYGNTYGIGMQADVQYYRSPSSFAWFKGGSHSDSKLNAGQNGSILMVIDDNARVGINTVSPQSQLHVNGDVRIQDEHPTFRFIDTNNGQNAFIQVNSEFMYFGNAFTDGTESNIMAINLATSNVGIGTTNADSKLIIVSGPPTQGSSTRALKIKRANASTQSDLNSVEMTLMPNYKNRENAFAKIRAYCHEEVIGTPNKDRGALQFLLGSNETENIYGLPAMTILNKNTTNFVGIGVTQPTANLEVGGDVKIATDLTFLDGTRQKINLLGSGYGIGVQTNTQYFRTQGNFAWYKGGTHSDTELTTTGGTPVMVMTTSGQLGIGTTQPTSGYELDVVGDARIRGHIHLDASDALLNVTGVNQDNYSNTYISFGHGGSINDWAYLRQIGTTDEIKFALDFHDNVNDAGFVIRDVQSTGQDPDIITDRFEVKRGGNTFINGNVGIGTQPDTNRLAVNGSVEVGSSGILSFKNSAGEKIRLYNAGADTVNFSVSQLPNELRYNIPTGYNHVFRINNSEKFRINETGDFNVSGNVYVGQNDSTVGPKSIYFGGTTGDNAYANTVIENRVYDVGNTASELLIFKGNDTNDRIRLRAGEIVIDTKAAGASRTASSPVMTIKNSGFVGLGTTTPSDQLHMTGSLRVGDARMTYSAISGLVLDRVGATNRFLADGYVCTGGTNKLLTTGLTATGATVNGTTVITGSVGIATTTTFPGKALYVNGDLRVDGNIRQGPFVVSIGEGAGQTSQQPYGIAVGYRAGYVSQNNTTVAMGYLTAYQGQQTNAVAIGYQAGETNQGLNSVALGYKAGQTNQHNDTIVINATTSAVNTTRPNATFIRPVRAATAASNIVAYTPEGELIDVTTMHFTSGGNLTTPGAITAAGFYGDAGFLSNIGGNFTNSIVFSNVEVGFSSVNSKYGISNTAPIHTLDVGANVVIQDTGSNVLTVRGNVLAQKITLGTVSITPAYTLQQVVTTGNTAANTIELTTATNSLVTSGRVGIKTSSPTFDLEVNGTAAKTGGGSWSSTSDRRLKEDIIDADLDRCYDIVKTIPLRRFKWKDGIDNFSDSQKDKNVLGWIAQEVEEVMPKSIEIMDEKYGIPDLKFLNPDQIYASMYGALQKAIQKIEQLEAELKKIKC